MKNARAVGNIPAVRSTWLILIIIITVVHRIFREWWNYSIDLVSMCKWGATHAYHTEPVARAGK